MRVENGPREPGAAALREAEEEVLRELVDALLRENVAGIRDRCALTDEAPEPEAQEAAAAEAAGGAAGPGGVASATASRGGTPGDADAAARWLRVDLGGGRALWIRVRRGGFLQPYRLSRPPVWLGEEQGGRVAWRTLGPAELLTVLADALGGGKALPGVDAFGAEVAVAVRQAASVRVAEKGVIRAAAEGDGKAPDAALLKWERVAALRDRPFHPTARAKSGFTDEDCRRYGPEGGEAFGLDWVAVRRDRVQAGQGDRDPASYLLDGKDAKRLADALAQSGLDPDQYIVLPVHPWQGEHVLSRRFADELAGGVMVPLARGIGRFVATSSVRTLAPADGGAHHVKVPLAVASLGALRTLPPRYAVNGASGQRLLERVIARDPALRGCLWLCDETRWWAYAAPGEDPFSERRDHLGCLVRTYPRDVVQGSGTLLMPMGALAVVDRAGRAPAVAHLLARRGAGNGAEGALALFEEVCDRFVSLALRLFTWGVMPEVHGQNTVLVVRGGSVAGLLLRDHDTVRVCVPYLARAGLEDPGYVIKPGTPNRLVLRAPEDLLVYFQTLGVQVNLHAIADALVRAYGVDEAACWRAIRGAVTRALDGLDAPGAVVDLLRWQLLESPTWPQRLILLPRLTHGGAPDTSMPAGEGRVANPLRGV